MDKLRILIPKGRIFNSVSQLFADAGFPVCLVDRIYRPLHGAGQGFGDWLDAKIMKPQNVGELLELGSHDAGFTGYDWISESGADVEEIMDLGFDKVRIVAAIPAGTAPEELKKRKIVAATEYMNLAERWLRSGSWQFRLLRTYGATEVFPPDDADMIIDNTSSGKTLSDNGLKIIDTLLESSTRFIASKAAMANKEKRSRIEELAMLFRAVLDGRDRVMLEMNVSEDNFNELVTGLPSMRSPTVSPLCGDNGFAVKIAVKKEEVPELIPSLKKLGATDIVEYDLRKVVP
ncbi:MAG: ATP phosphoribosyltransferase [Treponema sp.]|nr:ATP phosphoribosyltransferase [Treponema sp.]MCL2129462.1 ATP phosphoribosyltransferase [Treponema sp.]